MARFTAALSTLAAGKPARQRFRSAGRGRCISNERATGDRARSPTPHRARASPGGRRDAAKPGAPRRARYLSGDAAGAETVLLQAIARRPSTRSVLVLADAANGSRTRGGPDALLDMPALEGTPPSELRATRARDRALSIAKRRSVHGPRIQHAVAAGHGAAHTLGLLARRGGNGRPGGGSATRWACNGAELRDIELNAQRPISDRGSTPDRAWSPAS